MKTVTVDIVFPVFHGNYHEIETNVKTLVQYLDTHNTRYDWNIVLGINGKKAEKVLELAKRLGKEDPRIRFEYSEAPGKGNGVLVPWSRSKAEIVCYMDIDLATDISAIFSLFDPLTEGYDICIASRYHPKSQTNRKLNRKIVSLVYHKIFMKFFLGARDYTDGQCGFKAIRTDVLKKLLPLIENRNWFFESELLFLAQRRGFKITEIPVKWVESEHSGLSLPTAISEFLAAGLRLQLREKFNRIPQIASGETAESHE